MMQSSAHLLATMATVATLLFLPPAADGKVVLDLLWNGTDILEESFQEVSRVRSNLQNMADYLTSKIDLVMDSWCPRPFKSVMSQCFYVNNKHRTSWEDGRAFCRKMGGDLAQPTFINALLVVLTEQYPRERSVYLGASNRTREQGWQWLSGLPVDPNIWEDKLMPRDAMAENRSVEAKDDKAKDDKTKDGKAKGDKAKGDKAKDVKAKDVKAKDVKAKDVKAKDVKTEANKVEEDKAMCLVLCPDGCASSHVSPSGQDCDLDGAFVCEYTHE
ncbi:uncharacterized protein [Panulirus ornatus]|uniref:uncharacterized protein n=1 Tax=Panulirus ornatus TaxID=150431 RepID=UPI003A875389